MKRVSVLILIGALIFGLTGCAEKNEEESSSQAPTTAVTEGTTPAETTEESTSAPTQSETTGSTSAETQAPQSEPSEEPSQTAAQPSDTTEEVAGPTEVRITDLKSMSSTPKTTDRLVDVWGNTYDFAVTNEAGWTGDSDQFHYEYLNNAGYTHFTGTLYIPEGERSNRTTALIVRGDGYTLYTSPAMMKDSQPVAIDVDISGFSTIEIEWINNSTYSNFSDLKGCLADPCFNTVTNEGNSDPSGIYPVSIMDLPSTYSMAKRSNNLSDYYGTSYPIAVYNAVDAYHGNNLPDFKYLLNGKYARFQGVIYVPNGYVFTGSATMSVIADGTEIYKSSEISVESEPVWFDIDISGCNVLEITFSDAAWESLAGNDKYLCLAYPYLYEGDGPIGFTAATISRGYDATKELELDWGWSLFSVDATEHLGFDFDLAAAAAYLCEGTYHGQGDAERRMRALGFGEEDSVYYEADLAANTSPMTLGSVVTEINGEQYLIVAVAVRGTSDLGDVVTDIRSGLFNVDGFAEAGETAEEIVRQYCSMKRDKYQIDTDHTILFVTGHSLGAAIAGQVAGNLENEVATRNHIFAYTFASPYYETHGRNTEEYTNIHNIVNTEDVVPDFPLGGQRYGIDHEFTGSGSDILDQHMLNTYLYGLMGELTNVGGSGGGGGGGGGGR